jgi:hypothetical protein
MHGKGVEFLDFNLKQINNQTYKNIEIVISDHSQNNDIMELYHKWKNQLNIVYIKNNNNLGVSSSNVNNAINNSKGELIKILFQDDFLYHNNSIKDIIENFEDGYNWLVTSSTHTYDGFNFSNELIPIYNDNIHLGINTISSPSVLTIRKSVTERFDEKLIWLMDCDMYKQLYIKYGEPKIVKKVNVVNRLWGNRLSDTISQDIKDKEFLILQKKYS